MLIVDKFDLDSELGDQSCSLSFYSKCSCTFQFSACCKYKAYGYYQHDAFAYGYYQHDAFLL